MDHLKGLFGVNTFNKSSVTSVIGTYLKYAWDMYGVHLQNNPRYEHPPMIPKMERKVVIDNSKDKRLKNEGKTPPGSAR